MSKIDARLPDRLLAGLRIGPEWDTDITSGANGWEKRNGRRAVARWRATGSMAAYTGPDRAAFRHMFVVARGKLRAFRVKDPLDWIVSGEPLTVPVGTDDPVQLTRLFTFPGSAETYILPVRAPVAATVVVQDEEGDPVAGTPDPLTGLFTPASVWGVGPYTWSGQFDHWMRFESDWGALTAPAQNVHVADIELIEVK